MDIEALLEIGDRIVAQAGPGEQVEAYVVSDHETEVRAYNGELESFSSASSAGIGIRVIRDHRQGFASAGSLDEAVMAETLAEARDNAGFGEPDECYGLAEPDGVDPVDLDVWSDTIESYSTDAKIELAIRLERLTLEADPRMSGVESADYIDARAAAAIVSTAGVRIGAREAGCYLSSWAMAGDETDTQTGFGFSIGRDPAELDPEAAARDAADRATRLLGAVKPPSERLTVVFDPFVTAQFLGIVGATLCGEAVLKGRSPFADRRGDAIGSDKLTLIDDATNPLAYTATAVDDEGLATRPIALLTNGVLQGFVHDSYSARRLNTQSTGSAIRSFASTPTSGCQALRLEPGARSQEELLSSIKHGFLVQGVAGLHSGVNATSGDFSTGAEGLMIRGGATAEPIREVTIASTLQKMLQSVVEVGNDIEWLPMGAAGLSLVIDDVMLSGS